MAIPPKQKANDFTCGKGCIAALAIILILLVLLIVFYEPTPSAGDMCKIYG